MGWRETLTEARAVVHDTMKVPVILLASLASVNDSNSTDVAQLFARIHNSDKALGDQAGTSLNSAERYEPIQRAIFWVAELTAAGVTLDRNMVISVLAGEAYNIDTVRPQDRETITVEITRLDAEDSAGLPLPE